LRKEFAMLAGRARTNRCQLLLAGALVGALPGISPAADLPSCASNLSDLEDEASQAHNSAEEAESECEEYENCRSFPDVYDLLEDGCASSKLECHSATDTLKSELAGLAVTIWAIEQACGVDFSDTATRLMRQLEKKVAPPVKPK
jgi:hypothetical protein